MSAPNFLFIQADQMAAPVLPVYGHPLVKAPRLEGLARDGVVFENAYCNNPICASSRFSMMAGQLPSRIGAYDNAAEFAATVPTFAHYLRALGYTTCLSGKMHFVGPDQLHGFEERLTTDIYPSDFGWTPDWSRGDRQLPPSGMSMRSVVEAGRCRRSLQIDYDEDVGFQAVRKIYDYARDPDGKPFFLAASFTHPHNPFTITPEFWDLYDHDDIDLPRYPGKPVEERDSWSRRYHYLIRQDEHEITDEHLRAARHAYYGMVSYVDRHVGRLLDALEATGLADDTVVIFTADHGEMMGERGMWYKFNPFEWSVRVPLIVRAPGNARGRREAKSVSLVDLLPTLLDLATDGGPPDLVEPVDGRTWSGMLHGPDDSRPDEAMIEFTAEGAVAPCLILRKGPYKYVYSEPDPGMMFNVETDPGEQENLCGDPAHKDVEDEMLADVLGRWDPRRIGEDVLESQRRRLFIQGVLTSGRPAPWDYQPMQDASRQYLRSGGSPTMVKGLARFPYMEPVPPDFPRPAAV